MGRDITERKRMEEALRESEERFRLLVDGVKDYAIFMIDTEGRVVSWNDGAQRIKGWTAAEILGQHFSLFYPSELAEQGYPRRELEIAAASGQYHEEGQRVRKDGSRFWADITITALRDADGRLRGFAKLTRDITDRKQAEEAVRQRTLELQHLTETLEEKVKERTAEVVSVVETLQAEMSERKQAELALQEASLYARSLIEASLDPLVTISRDGKIMDVNRATELATGLSRDTLIGSNFLDYFTEPEKAAEGYEQVFSKGFVRDYPLAIRHASGKVTDVLYNAAVYRNEAGEVQGVLCCRS